MCLLGRRRGDAGLPDAVLDAKRQAMRSEGLLEAVRRDTTFDGVAGLRRLRDWIDKRRSALTTEGKSFWLETPQGLLSTGLQGCGENVGPRAITGEMGVQLAML